MGHILNNEEKFLAGVAFGCAVSEKKPVKMARFTIRTGTTVDIQEVAKMKDECT